MISPLAELEGLSVTEAAEVHDYIQFAFGKDIGISVFNPLEIVPNSSLASLIGRKILAIVERGDSIEFRLSGEVKLVIDMRQVSYKGPEALVLHKAGRSPIVWS